MKETEPATETLHLFNQNEHMGSVRYVREVNYRLHVFLNLEPPLLK
jgi:hypothetical protein